MVRTDAAGRAVEIRVEGKDGWGREYGRRIRVRGDSAVYLDESGREAVRGLPEGTHIVGGHSAALEILARASGATHGLAAHLVAPDGSGWDVELDSLVTITVERGADRRSITLYDLSWDRVWLDSELRFFGQAGFQSSVPVGWEDAAEAMLEAEQALAEPAAAEAAALLPHRFRAGLAFRNARVLDVSAGELREDMTVLVHGDRIRAVGPDHEIEVPPGVHVINADGRVLIPGLWEMHGHIALVGDRYGRSMLAKGVTTVRDLLSDAPRLRRKRRVDAGLEIGPRILTAGFIDGPGPYTGPTRTVVSNEEEARAAVAAYDQQGYSAVKLYTSVPPYLVPVIAEQAHARGMRVTGHLPAGMSVREAVGAGIKEIHHLGFLALDLLRDTTDTRHSLRRATAMAERSWELTHRQGEVEELARFLHESGTVVDPTLCILHNLATGNGGQRLPADSTSRARYRRSAEALKTFAETLHARGVTLVAGTDGACALSRELELLVESGIPPADVLRIATLGAARVVGLRDEVGAIQAGLMADLVLLRRNPLEDIAALNEVDLVVKAGLLLDPSDLRRR